MPAPEPKSPHEAARKITEEVGRKAERKLRARGGRHRSVWFGLGMFGLVGWSVAVPALAGIGLGIWLDSKFENGISWTLSFMAIGIVVGCLNAWYWVKREGRHDD